MQPSLPVPGWLRDRGRLALWLVAAALLLLLAHVATAFLGTLTIGVFVYYATRPVDRRVRRYVDRRSVATYVSLFLVSVPLLVLASYTVAVALGELSGVAPSVGKYASVLRPYVDPAVLRSPQQVFRTITTHPGRVGSYVAVQRLPGSVDGVVTALTSLVYVLVHAFLAVAVAYYLLRDDDRLAAWARDTLFVEDGVGLEFAERVDRNLERVYVGNLAFAVTNGVIAALLYNALNLVAPEGLAIPAPTLLGMLTGAASLVPLLGPKIVYVPILAYLVFGALTTTPSNLWFPVVTGVATAVLVDFVPEVVLRPYISGRHLHMGLVLFGYTFGTLLFGWFGLFLGPLLVVVLLEFGTVVLPELLERRTDDDGGDDGDRSRPSPDLAAMVRKPDDGAGGTAESADDR